MVIQYVSMSYGIHDIRGTHKHKYLLRVLILLFFKSVYIFLILKAHCVCVYRNSSISSPQCVRVCTVPFVVICAATGDHNFIFFEKQNRQLCQC